MDEQELSDNLWEMLQEFSVREIIEHLVDAMNEMGSQEDNPEAWARGAKSLERLAASKDFEDMVSW